jgi:hypothetical protein
MEKGLLRMLAFGGAALALAACQSTPPQPLFQPLESGAAFGYVERQIDETHWEVAYAGPRYRSSYGETKRDAEADAARTEAYNLALWRAAQITLEQKLPSFALVSERRDLDHATEVDRRYPGYPYYPFGFRNPGFWGYWPYFYDDYTVRSFGEATVTLTIDLEPDPGAQSLDAKATADRLEAEYAFKTWPPQ